MTVVLQHHIARLSKAVTKTVMGNAPITLSDKDLQDLAKGLYPNAARPAVTPHRINMGESSPNQPRMTTCPICYAEVKMPYVNDHMKWHNEMNEIMDKVGMGRPFPGLR